MELSSLILLALMFVVNLHISSSSPKIETVNSKLEDHKWPNFFNPKQSILRESEDKKDKKVKQKYSEDSPSGYAANVEENGKENDEDLIDYILKGNLRGTYFLLNGTATSQENLSDEAQTTINQILTEDDEVFDEINRKELLGEKTEEGLRLRTPLVTKLRTKSMGKYGAQISYFATEVSQHFIYFGNWCGKGGRSGPVDNIDGCCLEQEKCYGRQIRQCPDVWQKPYSSMYTWVLLEEKHPVCVRSESLCVNHVCNCDLEAALCFNHYINNPSEIPFHLIDDDDSDSRSAKVDEASTEETYYSDEADSGEQKSIQIPQRDNY